MIIVAGGIKGGSGKTTIATNLTVIRAAQGRDVLLIDADDQETSTDFTILRNERQPESVSYTSIKDWCSRPDGNPVPGKEVPGYCHRYGRPGYDQPEGGVNGG